jgi:LuxR family maltose regulon positive regulatory protein
LLLQGKHEDVITMLRASDGADHIEGELLLQRTLLASGREAPAPAQPSKTSTEAAPLEVQVTSWLVRAEQSMKERDVADGELCVQRALRLAAPQHLRRPFFEAPEEVRGLLERSGLGARSRWLQTSGPVPGGGPADGGVGGPNGHRSHEGPGGVAALANPLTAKEQEVLGFLAELLTTDEIAETMFVSVNTVRSHVRSILRKLGVTRRNEAVRRAWDLRLLPRRGAV